MNVRKLITTPPTNYILFFLFLFVYLWVSVYVIPDKLPNDLNPGQIGMATSVVGGIIAGLMLLVAKYLKVLG